MSDDAQTDTSVTDVDALFSAAQKRYSFLTSLKAGLLSNLFTGVHGRTGRNRIQRMRKANPAVRLEREFAELSTRQATYFLGLATANKEQAEAAFRYTAIVNFTAPITIVVLINQILPEGLIALLEAYLGLDALSLTLVVFLFVIAVIYPIAHAYLGAGNARDIYHLSMIELARRGGAPSMDVDSNDDLTSNPADG